MTRLARRPASAHGFGGGSMLLRARVSAQIACPLLFVILKPRFPAFIVTRHQAHPCRAKPCANAL
jgi:hypothetical protein